MYLWNSLFIAAIVVATSAAQSGTTLGLQSSSNPSTYGSLITLTATVSLQTASGTVTFYDGVTPIATVPIAKGQASYSTALLPPGTDPVRAYYSGDNDSPAASASMTQSVHALPGGGFERGHDDAVGYLPWSLAVGDFNEDGKTDVAVAFNSGDSIVVSMGNGDGSFQVPGAYSGVNNARWIVTGDFNGDGHADLAVANIGGDSVTVYLGKGDGTFGSPQTVGIGAGSGPFALVVGDFNGDGKADVAVTGDLSGDVTVLLGKGDGSFQRLAAAPCGKDPRSIAAGDFNGDGMADLVVGNYTAGMVTVLLGKGDGTFQAGTTYNVASTGDNSSPTNPRSIAVADFNNDGKMDLAVVNETTGTVDILAGKGDGSFLNSQPACPTCTSATSPAKYLDGPYALAAADMDGDNVLDLVATNTNGASVTLLHGNGDGQFTMGGTFTTGASPLWVAVTSLRNNGMADLITANESGTISTLLALPPAPDLTTTWQYTTSSTRFDIVVKNAGYSPTSGQVMVTVTLPAGVTASALDGSGWSCSAATLTCTRSDALAPSRSYPITITLDISASAAAGITVSATVSGGGDTNPANNSASEYAAPFTSAQVNAVWPTLTSVMPKGLTNPDAPFLMTDGSIMVHQYCTGDWYKLTPGPTGSYESGTWMPVAPMPSGYAPVYFASAVLPDGRLVTIGGEYNGTDCSAHAFTTMGAIYDPVADAWTSLNAPEGWSEVGDAPSTVLADGRFVLGQITGTAMAALDRHTLTWTTLNTGGKEDTNSEEGWTLLPDGSLLTIDTTNAGESERYLPGTGNWIRSGDTVAPLVTGREMGPQVLLPSGSVFAAGATGHTALFDPGTGTWSAGPDFPAGPSGLIAVADAPGVLLPSGNVLIAASAYAPDMLALYQELSFFFEYDGVKLNPVPALPGIKTGSYRTHLLLLPTGNVLFTDRTNLGIYTPSGSAAPGWAPTIASAPATVESAQTYTIFGTQFNGMSQAVMYGDDYQAATNFPLVRITNNASGRVVYCRTHDHSTMAVATGAETVSTQFDIPHCIGTDAGCIESGPSTIAVVANGIASATKNVTVMPATTAGVSIATIEGGALSAPAVKGISSNGYFTIFGSGFEAGSPAPHTADALVNGAFPTVLGGACVYVGSARAFVTYVSDTQINAIAPPLPTSGSMPISVAANCGLPAQVTSATVMVSVAPETPEFLYWTQNANGQNPVIAEGNYNAYIGPTGQSSGIAFRGAHPGEMVTVYGIGFGATKSGPVPGAPAGDVPDELKGTYSVSIGGEPAQATYAGVTPKSAGLYQINLTVPADLTPGNYPIVLTINGVSTPAGAYLTVGQ